jgi:hypothetical protein
MYAASDECEGRVRRLVSERVWGCHVIAVYGIPSLVGSFPFKGGLMQTSILAITTTLLFVSSCSGMVRADTSPCTIEGHLVVPLMVQSKGRTGQKYDEIRETFACHFNP